VISVARLKTALRIDALEDAYGEEEQVAYLEDLEAAAVAFIERYTGRYFGPPHEEPVPLVLTGYGSPALYLPHYASQVTAVASRAYPGGEETEIEAGAADGWSLTIPAGGTHSNVLGRHGGSVWGAGGEYMVTAVIGYEPGEEPADIRQAVIDLVGWWWEERVPATDANGAPDRIRLTLNPWRRMVA
jgi:hypothetical protein